MHTLYSVAMSLLAAHIVVSDAAAQPVTACGQRVSEGVLVADLDCTGFEGDAVQVESSLDLGGFTLSGGSNTDVSSLVRCVRGAEASDGRCEVSGPGTLRGTGSFPGAHGVRGKQVFANDVTFDGNLTGGVVAVAKAEVHDCTFNDVSGVGVWSVRSARVYDSSVTGSGRFGVAAGRLALLVRSTVMGSVLDGVVSGGGVALQGSSVVGNAIDPNACATGFGSSTCGSEQPAWICADISADKRVRLRDGSSCGSSLVQDGRCGGPYDLRSGNSFGVCADD